MPSHALRLSYELLLAVVPGDVAQLARLTREHRAQGITARRLIPGLFSQPPFRGTPCVSHGCRVCGFMLLPRIPREFAVFHRSLVWHEFKRHQRWAGSFRSAGWPYCIFESPAKCTYHRPPLVGKSLSTICLLSVSLRGPETCKAGATFPTWCRRECGDDAANGPGLSVACWQVPLFVSARPGGPESGPVLLALRAVSVWREKP